jgi:hypothetical protein
MPCVAVIGGAVDQQQRRPGRAGGVEGLSASGQVAAVPGDGQFHAGEWSAGLHAGSGQNVRFQQVLEQVNAVLEQQLAFLEASDQQVVGGGLSIRWSITWLRS